MALSWRKLSTPMAKKATTKVYVWKTKHKGTDVFKAAYDKPGNAGLVDVRKRYTRKHGARKGGARAAGAWWHRDLDNYSGQLVEVGWKDENDRYVEFIHANPKAKK